MSSIESTFNIEEKQFATDPEHMENEDIQEEQDEEYYDTETKEDDEEEDADEEYETKQPGSTNGQEENEENEGNEEVDPLLKDVDEKLGEIFQKVHGFFEQLHTEIHAFVDTSNQVSNVFGQIQNAEHAESKRLDDLESKVDNFMMPPPPVAPATSKNGPSGKAPGHSMKRRFSVFSNNGH